MHRKTPDDRARITITDVVLVVFGVAALSGLYPVYSTLYEETAPELGPMTDVTFQVLVPVAMVVLVAMLARKALRGTA